MFWGRAQAFWRGGLLLFLSTAGFEGGRQGCCEGTRGGGSGVVSKQTNNRDVLSRQENVHWLQQCTQTLRAFEKRVRGRRKKRGVGGRGGRGSECAVCAWLRAPQSAGKGGAATTLRTHATRRQSQVVKKGGQVLVERAVALLARARARPSAPPSARALPGAKCKSPVDSCTSSPAHKDKENQRASAYIILMAQDGSVGKEKGRKERRRGGFHVTIDNWR